MVSRAWSIRAITCVVAVCGACTSDSSRKENTGDGTDAGVGTTVQTGSADAAIVNVRDGATGAADGASSTDDPEPTFTAEARAALGALRYDPSPFAADPSNRVADDPAARELGHRLFFDTSLSGRLIDSDNDGSSATLGHSGETGKVSCAGCHVPQSGFVDTRSPHQQISLAAQWGRRRAPTLLEVGGAPRFDWDGRHDSLWGQAIEVMEATSEFNSGRLFVAEQIFRLYRDRYEAVFGKMPPLDDTTRFPALTAETVGCQPGAVSTGPCRGKPGDHAEYDGMSADAKDAVTTVIVNAAKSMGAYVRQLRCGPSKFDQWLDGKTDALSRSEQRGAALFVGSAKCVSCHSGPNLTDGKFHNVGLRPSTVAVAFTDTDDRGAAAGLALSNNDPLSSRSKFSDSDGGVPQSVIGPELEGAFRTPTLRCIARQPSFMHTGQHKTLQISVGFFSRGGDQMGFPGTNELTAVNLTTGEQADLVAFMLALQGDGPEPALLAAP